MLTRLVRRLRRFSQDSGGSVLAEAVITLPLLLWAYMAMFVFWDAYRSLNIMQKASYTISDMISREVSLPTTYINGLDDIFDYLLLRTQAGRLLVTSVVCSAPTVPSKSCDSTKGQFQVEWSRSPGNSITPLTTTTLQGFKGQIPAMSDGDTVIIVQTEMTYVPAFDVGLGRKIYQQFIVTRPRFSPRIVLSS